MTNKAEIFKKIENWQTKSAQEIYNELITIVKIPTNARHNWTSLRNLFPDKYLGWKIALTQALELSKDNLVMRVKLEDIFDQLDIGPNFSHQTLQSQIDELVINKIISDEDGELLKALGFEEKTLRSSWW